MTGPLAPPRPRPVADAPVPALVAAAGELAKRWLLSLLAAGPLDAADRLPVGELARQAPALCGQIVRALASDAQLHRLEPGGDLRELAASTARLAGGDDGLDSVAGVELLRRVLWDALDDELRRPPIALVADLSSRLAYACSVVASAALAAPPAAAHRAAGGRSGGPSEGEPAARRWEAPDAPPVELAPEAGWDRGAWAATHERSGPSAADELPLRLSRYGPRAADGAPAWQASIERRLERFVQDARPFAVLLLEVVDVDRLRQAETESGLARLVAAVEHALSGELRPADALTREAPGRYWLVTPDTDRRAARELAVRLADAVESSTAHRGAPLTVAVGTAVCPDDGRDAAALCARADMSVFGARAAGSSLAPLDDGS